MNGWKTCLRAMHRSTRSRVCAKLRGAPGSFVTLSLKNASASARCASSQNEPATL